MDERDKQLLREAQSNLPICERPFKALGERVGMSEQEVLERLKRLKAQGVIRRIGGSFDSAKLGFASTLCAAKVPEEKLKDFVETVNSYHGVTHNYRRGHEFNVWFTFIAESEQSINQALAEIAERTGVKEICSLPAVEKFKIKVDFPV